MLFYHKMPLVRSTFLLAFPDPSKINLPGRRTPGLARTDRRFPSSSGPESESPSGSKSCRVRQQNCGPRFCIVFDCDRDPDIDRYSAAGRKYCRFRQTPEWQSLQRCTAIGRGFRSEQGRHLPPPAQFFSIRGIRIGRHTVMPEGGGGSRNAQAQAFRPQGTR